MASAAETASSFGYSVAFFNSDPELKRLLNKAVSDNWTTAQFVAKLRATRWFKTHSLAARKMQALKSQDPATYWEQRRQMADQVRALAGSLGAHLTGNQVATLSAMSLNMGWTQQQLTDAVGAHVRSSHGRWTGQAASVQSQIDQLQSDYGVGHSGAWRGMMTRRIVTGHTTIDDVKRQFQTEAASKYPALADRINGGETVAQIADPYKQAMAQTLEINPNMIRLNDHHIQAALTAKNKDGKPTTQTVWQFEQNLRRDPRWLGTQNAQDKLVGTTHQVLQDMGLVN